MLTDPYRTGRIWVRRPEWCRKAATPDLWYITCGTCGTWWVSWPRETALNDAQCHIHRPDSGWLDRPGKPAHESQREYAEGANR